jgi:hypothetical protein
MWTLIVISLYSYLDGDIKMHDFSSLANCQRAMEIIMNDYPRSKLKMECVPK